MDNSKIMERINNLLSKTEANGCTPEEAASACAMAQKLIAKYHVDMREFSESEEIEKSIEYCEKPWQHSLAHVISENTCCKVISTQITRGKKRLTFVGRDTDRLAVLKMYDKLMMVCQKGILAEKKRYKELYGTTKGVEVSYSRGFIDAVDRAMGEQCRALALVTPQEVVDKFNNMFPSQRHTNRKVKLNGDCYERGRADGFDAAGRKSITA